MPFVLIQVSRPIGIGVFVLDMRTADATLYLYFCTNGSSTFIYSHKVVKRLNESFAYMVHKILRYRVENLMSLKGRQGSSSFQVQMASFLDLLK